MLYAYFCQLCSEMVIANPVDINIINICFIFENCNNVDTRSMLVILIRYSAVSDMSCVGFVYDLCMSCIRVVYELYMSCI